MRPKVGATRDVRHAGSIWIISATLAAIIACRAVGMAIDSDIDG